MEYPTRRQLLELTADERLRLLADVWDLLADDPVKLPVSEEHRAELDARLEALRANPSAGAPWPEVQRRILDRRG